MRARLFGCALALLVPACSNSSSTETTAPSTVKCEITLQNSMNGTAPAAGGSGTLAVTTTRDCTWTATSDAAWLTISSGTNGQGSGSVAYAVAANGQPSQRRGTLAVNGQQMTVTQDAAPCRFNVTPTNSTVSMQGGTVNVNVETLTGCAWTAQSTVSWMSIASGAAGNGNGAVAVQVAANGGDARSGAITVAGITVTIDQGQAPCSAGVTPTSLNVPFGGGAASATVTVRPGCAWTASSGVSWISITSGSSGNGNGTVALQIAANDGDARNGSITVAGLPVAIAQAAAPCTFGVAPPSLSVPSGGGAASATVTARTGCAWTAASSTPWIAIASGSSGSGNGTVALQIAVNDGDARNGSITVAGTTVAVAQAGAPCTFGVSPLSQNVPVEGASGSATVAVRAGCTWTAVSNAPWITITGGASGNGGGAVAFIVASNPGPPRTGTLTIANMTFTVSQATVPCTYGIVPWMQSIGGGGGTGESMIATGPTCPWSAVPNVPWITMIGAASGVGNGRIEFAIGVNTGADRTGTISITGGQTFTVTQGAALPPQ
ncbi:MAG TPA: BACON domain-containing carbohydrate-binding protein [Vicinamibacterales bacterium]|jgi:hypothetical protein